MSAKRSQPEPWSESAGDVFAALDAYLDHKLRTAIEAHLPVVLEKFLADRPAMGDGSKPEPKNQGAEFLSKREVVKVTGLSSTTIWRMTRRGEFPTALSLSENRIGWRSSDIDNWLSSRSRTRTTGCKKV